MENKKTVLLRVAYLVELKEEDINDDNGILDKVENKISQDMVISIDNRDIELEWNSTSYFRLDSEVFNCGKCANCGQWTTDREKPDSIDGLCNGATVENKLLCDECLPHNHR